MLIETPRDVETDAQAVKRAIVLLVSGEKVSPAFQEVAAQAFNRILAELQRVKDERDTWLEEREGWLEVAFQASKTDTALRAELQQVKDDREKWMRKAIDQASQVLALRAALEGTDQ